MAQRVALKTYYDFAQVFDFRIDNERFNMADATDVKAALIDPRDGELFLSAVTQTNTGNADWSQSLVEIVFSASFTSSLQMALINKYSFVECELNLEIRVNRPSGNEPWGYLIAIEQGFITA